jgi:DNA polymerase-3 subunit delta
MGAFIFLGPELGKKQDALLAVKKKITNPEEFTYYAGETPARIIADTLQNHCLFSDTRIIIVKNAELIKQKDDIDLISLCIRNIESNTTLILLSDETKLASGLDNAVPAANKQIFYELFEREKSEWLRSFFRQEGYTIDKDGINAILEMVENNTEALRTECTRLMYFLPKDKPCTSQDIEKWLSHNREETVFNLFSRIASGDLSKSLESLAAMLAAKESAQGILAGLAWRFRKLQDYINLAESGNLNNIELKKLGLSLPKIKDDFAAAARRYGANDVEKCLAMTARYDTLLRSPAAAMENLLMDRYILNIIKVGA